MRQWVRQASVQIMACRLFSAKPLPESWSIGPLGTNFSEIGMYRIKYISRNMHTFFCFAVLCCGYTLTDFPIFIRLTSLALWQSNDCPSTSKATLMNMDKYFMWIHYERLHNHNKAKHNKTVCIFLGIYCIWQTITEYQGAILIRRYLVTWWDILIIKVLRLSHFYDVNPNVWKNGLEFETVVSMLFIKYSQTNLPSCVPCCPPL